MKGKQNAAAGFTLIELALVLLIVGVMLSLLVPRLPGMGETHLEAAGRKLAAQMAYLYDEAALRGRIYRLRIDMDNRSYDVSVMRPFADRSAEDEAAPAGGDDDGFSADWDPYTARVELPPGVEVAAVSDSDGESYSGSSDIYFLPEGGAESVHVRLREEDGGSLEVGLESSSGRVEIVEPDGGN